MTVDREAADERRIAGMSPAAIRNSRRARSTSISDLLRDLIDRAASVSSASQRILSAPCLGLSSRFQDSFSLKRKETV
jgi:hypothetical protein